MRVFSWNDIISDCFDSSVFGKGLSLCIGSFDGPHIGHKCLFDSVLENSRKNGYSSCVVTFCRPMPSYKHNNSYFGDISTLAQRLDFFTDAGFDLCILIDFSEEFGRLSGSEFLNVLYEKCGTRFIAEGKDFHFGYKGLSSIKDVLEFSRSHGILCDFPQLLLKNELRISSSLIRRKIFEGKLSEVQAVLCRPYSVDLRSVKYTEQDGKKIFRRMDIKQVLPPDGLYQGLSEGTGGTLEITADFIVKI